MAVVRLVQGPRRGGRHGLFGVTGTLVAMSQDDRPQDDRPQGLARRFLKDVSEHDVGGLSAEMAYRFLFAVFPFGLFVAALGAVIAGWLRVDDPAGQIVGALGDNLPAEIANAVRPELERLLTTARTDLVLLGALAALWAATGGTNALSKGIHRAYGVEEQRPFVLRYAVAIGLTLLGAVGIIAAFVTIIGGAMVTEQVAEELGPERRPGRSCSGCVGRRSSSSSSLRSRSSIDTRRASSSRGAGSSPAPRSSQVAGCWRPQAWRCTS
jgi:hypothetical protein